MTEIFSNLVDLALLVVLQAVLGFDNLLYISLEANEHQKNIKLECASGALLSPLLYV